MNNKKDISPSLLALWLSNEQPANDADLRHTEGALVAFGAAHAVEPPAFLRSQVLAKMAQMNAQKRHQRPFGGQLFPMLDESSNWLDWEAAVAHIAPPAHFDNIHLHTLESNDKRELYVAWVKEFIEEEVHTDLLESFLLLDGSCECHIAGKDGQTRIVRMCQGDFLTLKLGETHDIIITSPQPAKAILQWVKLAA